MPKNPLLACKWNPKYWATDDGREEIPARTCMYVCMYVTHRFAPKHKYSSVRHTDSWQRGLRGQKARTREATHVNGSEDTRVWRHVGTVWQNAECRARHMTPTPPQLQTQLLADCLIYKIHWLNYIHEFFHFLCVSMRARTIYHYVCFLAYKSRKGKRDRKEEETELKRQAEKEPKNTTETVI